MCGPKVIRGPGGVLTSPNYPHAFPDNVECTWMIRVKNHQRILLNFLNLDIGPSGESQIKPRLCCSAQTALKAVLNLKHSGESKARPDRGDVSSVATCCCYSGLSQLASSHLERLCKSNRRSRARNLRQTPLLRPKRHRAEVVTLPRCAQVRSCSSTSHLRPTPCRNARAKSYLQIE